MAEQILTNAKIWMDGWDISGNSNSVAGEYTSDILDKTTFSADGFRSKIGGLKTNNIEVAGFWDGVDLDQQLFDRIGVSNTLVSLSPDGGAEGERAFFAKVISATYNPGGTVGEVMPFSISSEGDSPMVGGVVLANLLTAVASGQSSGQQLGAATTSFFVGVHVLTADGTSPTLTVDVESDDNAGFTSAVSRWTSSEFTAKGSAFAEIAGSVADDYWRVNYTIGGTSPDFDVIVAIGIN